MSWRLSLIAGGPLALNWYLGIWLFPVIMFHLVLSTGLSSVWARKHLRSALSNNRNRLPSAEEGTDWSCGTTLFERIYCHTFTSWTVPLQKHPKYKQKSMASSSVLTTPWKCSEKNTCNTMDRKPILSKSQDGLLHSVSDQHDSQPKSRSWNQQGQMASESFQRCISPSPKH